MARFLVTMKDRGNSKLCFNHKDLSVNLNFELRYNEWTLVLIWE